MSKKLAAKASLIQMPPLSGVVAPPRPERTEGAEQRPKTAPGSMAVFMASQSAAVREVDELREKLSAFDGAKPVRPLDPQLIRPSRWANRHEHSFADPAFLELKADIAAAGSNVQPIVVRTSQKALNGSTPEGGQIYEVVFGHRRHRACLELGLPVQAMVTEMTDQALFEAMERENRARKNLSAWEQGTMYRRALDEGLYPSQRRLADALSVDVALVSKSLTLARLPDAVIAAFQSPLDIQYRWAQPLAAALQKDPDGMLQRAAQIRKAGGALPAAKVLKLLIGEGDSEVLNRSTPRQETVEGPAGRRATWRRESNGIVIISLSPGVLGESEEAGLKAYLQQLVTKA